MTRLFNLPILLGIFVFFSGGPSASEHPAANEKIVWETSWANAVKRAKAENRPIMIHFNMNDEPACRNMAKDHFRNKRVIELSKQFVCVVGSLGTHEEETVFQEEGKCGRFGTVTCQEHRKTEIAARSTVMESSRVTAPQFVFVTPDLDVMVRRPWDLPSSELIALMSRALYYFNPSLSPEAIDKRASELMKRLLDEGKSDNAATRKKAMDALAKRDDPKVIQFLIRQTKPDVDLVKRIEAVQAIGDAVNATCLPALLKLLKDRSPRLRLVTMVALGKLGMRECIEPVAKVFGVESSSENKALAVRTAITCDPDDKTARKLLNKGLKASKSEVRLHSARACLEVAVDKNEFSKLIKMARGDTDMKARAVGCHASTTLAIRYRDNLALTVDGRKRADFALRRKKILALTKSKLRPALRKIAAGDKEESLREFATLCLSALDSQDFVDLDGDLEEFFNDEEAFNPEGGSKKKRRGRGGRR